MASINAPSTIGLKSPHPPSLCWS